MVAAKKKTQYRRTSGRPTKEDSAAIEDRLLDSARVLFARKGFANTTLDDVAVTLGASKNTIYRRFSGKESLFDAVVDRDIQRFRDQLLITVDAETPMEALHQCARRYFDFGVEETYAALYLFIMAEAAISLEMRQKLESWSAYALEPLQTVIKAAQACGDLGSASATDTCDVLANLLDGAAARTRQAKRQRNRAETATALFEQRWKLFLKLFSKSGGTHH